MEFKGTKNYISTDDLSMAVNAAKSLKGHYWLKENLEQVKLF